MTSLYWLSKSNSILRTWQHFIYFQFHWLLYYLQAAAALVSLAAVTVSPLQLRVLGPECRRLVYIGATPTCDLSAEDSHHDPQAHNNNPRHNT